MPAPDRPTPATDPTPRRVFLGRARPLLELSAEWLVRRGTDPPAREADLTGITVVVPGSRARRHLLALLAEIAAGVGVPLWSPRIIGPDDLIDLVYGTGDRPRAADLERVLAWSAALRDLPHQLRRLLVPRDPGTAHGWAAFARLMVRASDELARELHRFEDAALAAAEPAVGRGDLDVRDRLAAAAEAQQIYEARLGDLGLADAELARLAAIRSGRPGSATPVVIVGATGFTAAAACALRAARHATALIAAPPDEHGRFDDLGRIVTESWADSDPSIRDDQLVFADGPADQADRVMALVSSLGAVPADDVVFVAPDPAAGRAIIFRAAESGLRVRPAAGSPTAATPPGRLLTALRDLLATPTISSLAELIRLPDVAAVIADRLGQDRAMGPAGWVASIDRYLAEHLDHGVAAGWITTRDRTRLELESVTATARWLAGDLWPGSGDRPVRAWADEVLALAGRVFGRLVLRRGNPAHDPIIDGCGALRDACAALARSGAGTPVPAVDALNLMAADLAARRTPEPADDRAIDLSGWLEAALDPAPAVIVASFSEGVVPESPGPDPLLPPRLRERLGLATDRTRLARDVFLSRAISECRPHAWFISPRRTAAGDPAWPSRVIFNTASDRAAARIRRFVSGADPAAPAVRPRPRAGRSTGFPARPCSPAAPLVMPVTSFRDYLASPYRYYLKHVLKLRRTEDPPRELSSMAFGTLIHEVLQRLARSPVAESDSPWAVREFFDDALTDLSRVRLGRSPPPAAAVQVEIARRRLAELAAWQAGRVRDGWQLFVPPEWSPAAGHAPLLVDGVATPITGRIDRVDRHAESGRLCIIDFKCGDTATPPKQQHRRRGAWADLQLPLYRHLAAELGATDDTLLGFVVVPRQPGGVRLELAGWTPAELADADEAARRVVLSVRLGRYGDPGREDRFDSPAVKALCAHGRGQTGAGAQP